MVYVVAVSLYAALALTAALSAASAYFYRRSIVLFGAVIAASIAILAVAAAFGQYQYFMAAFAAGGMAGWVAISSARRSRHGENARLERRRDAVHIFIGVAAIALFAGAGIQVARYVLLASVIALYTLNAALNRFRRSKAAKALLALERPDAVYGEGAALLAFGVLIVTSLIGSGSYIYFALIALLFGDASATIVGTYLGKVKMPYSRRKSVAGTAAFFIVVGALGFPFVGWYALPFALALALLESVETRIDDNALVAVGLLAIYAVMALA